MLRCRFHSGQLLWFGNIQVSRDSEFSGNAALRCVALRCGPSVNSAKEELETESRSFKSPKLGLKEMPTRFTVTGRLSWDTGRRRRCRITNRIFQRILWIESKSDMWRWRCGIGWRTGCNRPVKSFRTQPLSTYLCIYLWMDLWRQTVCLLYD